MSPIKSRNIFEYPSYSPNSTQNQVIPVSIPTLNQDIKQPSTMIQNSSKPMLMQDLSEEQMLNSLYKRVFLNTVV